MKITQLELINFKRFTELRLVGIPATDKRHNIPKSDLVKTAWFKAQIQQLFGA
ncbi:MAG: hypothetical protein WCR52_12580 [Bacteroidota bacterium]